VYNLCSREYGENLKKQEKRKMSHKTIENEMRAIINNLLTGTEFSLKDIIENPPA